MLASDKWVKFESDECAEISLAYFLSQAVFQHVVSKDFIFKKSMQGTTWFCILPRMKKSMALFHSKKFWCHVTLATFKNMWITSGSHLDCSVGQWVKYVSRCDPLLNIANILLPTMWKLQQIKGTLLPNTLFAPLSLLQYCIIYTHIGAWYYM